MTEKPERSQPRRGRDDEPVLPRTADNDRDEVWGDAPRARDRDWYDRERPPHHG